MGTNRLCLQKVCDQNCPDEAGGNPHGDAQFNLVVGSEYVVNEHKQPGDDQPGNDSDEKIKSCRPEADQYVACFPSRNDYEGDNKDDVWSRKIFFH